MDEERTGFITIAMVKQNMEGDLSCIQSHLLLSPVVVRMPPASSKRPHSGRGPLSANALQSPVCNLLGLPSAVPSEQALARQAQGNRLANAALPQQAV